MVVKMDSTRRSFDRSREPGPKKPRLNEELNGRTFPQRPTASGINPSPSRIRNIDRDSESIDSNRGAYQPQQPQQQQLHHELVSQYKTALAELTFNSKPIITNLTIIAGENLQAAKAITATVCSNIVEVPSEQKLPSLYLLDSIVKNIGRDYIKYFAARLPEVFCKAYRQVEGPIHTSMRHLFGTWKGVFPPQALQMIEKELGFASAVNGLSSGATTSRPDSESQRPPHSIHVNPKYLERQRIQQSSQAKGIANDMTGPLANSIEDAERPARAGNINTGGSWVDPVKMNNIHRKDAINERAKQKSIGAQHGGYEYGSDLSKSSESGIGRTIGRVIEEAPNKPWYSVGSNVPEKEISGQRNGFITKNGYPIYQASKLAGRISSGISSSWKNSEEEEFMWDDISSRLSDHSVGTANVSSNLRNDKWIPDNSDRSEFGNQIQKPGSLDDIGSRIDREDSVDSFSSEQKEQTAFGHQMPSSWSLQESHSTDEPFLTRTSMFGLDHSEGQPDAISGLPINAGSLARIGQRALLGSSNVEASGSGSLTNAVSGSTGIIGQKRFQSVGAGSPPEQSPIRQHHPSFCPAQQSNQLSQKLAEKDHRQAQSLPQSDLNASQFMGWLSIRPHNKAAQGSLKISPSNLDQGNLQKSQSKDLQAPSLSMPCVQRRNHYPSSQQLELDPTESEHVGQKFDTPSEKENSAPGHPESLATETLGGSSTSSLLAAFMKSGILSNMSITGSLLNMGFQEMGQMPSQSVDQPPTKFTSPESKVASTSQTEEEHSSLKHSPAISSRAGTASPETSNLASNASNPISNLLSSLVTKGLISASKKESPTLMPSKMPGQSQNKSPGIATSSSVPVSSIPSSSTMPISSAVYEVPLSKPADTSGSLPKSTSVEIKNFIGFEFRPEVIRELHSSVINGFSDGLPHRCEICRIQLKFEEQLEKHLEWHAVKETGPGGLHRSSRRWYPNSDEWLAHNSGFRESTVLVKESAKSMQEEAMVPADESQCACVLCGEHFEDCYSQESDEWMFKGAVYTTIPFGNGEVGMRNESSAQGLIVHSNCISESSFQDSELADIKMDA